MSSKAMIAATGLAALLAAQTALAHGGMHGASGRSMRGSPMHDGNRGRAEHRASRDFHERHGPHGNRFDRHDHARDRHAGHGNDGRWRSERSLGQNRGQAEQTGLWSRVPGFGAQP